MHVHSFGLVWTLGVVWPSWQGAITLAADRLSQWSTLVGGVPKADTI